MDCPACNGKRWVDSPTKGPTVCPLCNGDGKAKAVEEPSAEPKEYNQDRIWIKLVKEGCVPLVQKIDEATEMIASLTEESGRVSLVVHLLFDKNITPDGSLFFEQLTLGGRGIDHRLSNDVIEAKNYNVLDDGKIDTAGNVPVSPIYRSIESALNRPEWEFEDVWLDPNRKGNPLFTDNNMIAVGIVDSPKTVALSLKGALVYLQQLMLFDFKYRIINMNVSVHKQGFGIREVSKEL